MTMTFLQFAEKVFPGFASIEEAERDIFLQSPEGLQLSADFKACSQVLFDTSIIFSPQLNQDKINAYRLSLGSKPSFIALRTEIVRIGLQKKYTWFEPLNHQNQKVIAGLSYSQYLFPEPSEARFTKWSQSFYTDRRHALVEPIRQEIIQNRADKLLNFFQFLIKTDEKNTQKDALLNTYQQALKEHTPNLDEVETIWLNDLLQTLLTEQLQAVLPGYVADSQLHDAVQPLHQAAQGKKEWSTKIWFDFYKKELLTAVNQHHHFKSGQTWRGQQTASLLAIQGSLSWMFQNVSQYEPTQFLNEMGDAKLFFQYSGFASQSGGMLADFLDFYNFARHRKTITEVKNITAVLLAPHEEWLNEYRQMAKYEKNVLNIFIRTLMPVVVMGLFLAGVCMLLTPLALPEIFSLLMMIPALYVGAAIASGYIYLRNQLITNSRLWWWGGIYNTPEFQVNHRLVEAFGQKNAECVRTFYVEELSACTEIEASYLLRAQDGLLSEEDINARHKNLLRQSELYLEWYDMHSNFKVGFDKAPTVVAQRIYKDSSEAYQKHQNDSKEYVTQWVEAVREREAHTEHTRLTRSTFFQPQGLLIDKKLSKCTESNRQLNRLGLFATWMNDHDIKPHGPTDWNYPPLNYTPGA